jgi:hypothetical protein
MDEEDFGALGSAAVEEEAGGGFGHGLSLTIIGVGAVDSEILNGSYGEMATEEI